MQRCLGSLVRQVHQRESEAVLSDSARALSDRCTALSRRAALDWKHGEKLTSLGPAHSRADAEPIAKTAEKGSVRRPLVSPQVAGDAAH